MSTPKEIGKIFAEARKARGLSVDEAYRASRMHPNVIKDIESGIFDRLGKAYIKSFIKKYSDFLELDTEDIVRQYESVSSGIPVREFELPSEEGTEPGIGEIFASMESRLHTVFAVAISVIFVILIIAVVGMIKGRAPTPPQKETKTTIVEKEPVPAKKEKPPVPKRAVSERPKKSGSFTLTLRSNGEAWVQVNKGDDVLFSGNLDKGDSRTWKSDGTLTVWSGRADKLDFTLNGRRIGVVAAGVVKNIEVSSEGVKIGDVWVVYID